jgi:hypothetical protein
VPNELLLSPPPLGTLGEGQTVPCVPVELTKEEEEEEQKKKKKNSQQQQQQQQQLQQTYCF